MPLPQPEVALNNACSVIYGNTLYTYSQDAFQALPLSPGGNWTQLPAGEKVTGGACVGSTPADAAQAAFYVVGGKGPAAYPGMQRFLYATGKWETITPTSLVTQDRQGHAAVYLKATDSILVYAGTQDATVYPTSHTFTIGMQAPFQALAYTSIAPPAMNPILLPWSDDQAAYIGGSASNTQVMLFSQGTKWMDSGATLAKPLEKDTSAIKAVLMKGDDASKSIYTFDMSVSPNKVERVVVIDGKGAPVQKAAAIARRAADEDDQSVKPLTESSWPTYNSTLAPSAVRANYALAQSPDGVVVIAGGNKDDVLCIFNARSNGWQNATARFEQQKVFAAEISSSASSSVATSTAASTTSTVTSATTSASSTLSLTSLSTTATGTPLPTALGIGPITSGSGSATSTDSGTSVQAILGGVLGSIAGVALILLVLYFCVVKQRKRQAHQETGRARRTSGFAPDEKDAVAMANDSFPHSPTNGTFRAGHKQQDSSASYSSMAILMGRANGNKPQALPTVSRNGSNKSQRESGDSIFRAFKSTISKPMMQEQGATSRSPPPRPARDDKGVSFAENTPEPRARPLMPNNGAVDPSDTTRRSSGWNRYWSDGSALNILGYGGKGNQDSKRTTQVSETSNYSDMPHRATQDSATVPPLNVFDARASFARVNSGSPTVTQFRADNHQGMSGQIERPISVESDISGYSSGIPASVHEAWDPTAANAPWGAGRATMASSFYSTYTTPLAPSQQAPPPTRPPRPPTGVSQQPQLAMAATSSDMSWLNLGEGRQV